MAKSRKIRETLGDQAEHDEIARAAETSPSAFCEYLRRLYERQELRAFQTETRRFNMLVVNGGFSDIDPKYGRIALRSSELAALPEPEISALLHALRPIFSSTGKFDAALEAAEFRLSFRRSIAAEFSGEFSPITLGLNCLPWVLLNQWGLRRPEEFFSTCNPFALSRHKYNACVADLSSDFTDYAPLDQIFSFNSKNSVSVPVRSDRGVVWIHNQGEFWLRNEYEEFKRSIDEGIASFRASARLKNPVFIMANAPFDYPKEQIKKLKGLHSALSRITGGENYSLLMTNQRISEYGTRSFEVDARTSYIYVPYPRKDYIWFAKSARDSQEGLLYERSYIEQILLQLERWNVLTRRTEGLATEERSRHSPAEASE